MTRADPTADERATAVPTGDRIVLRGLRAHGRHGVLATEREAGQSFGLDLELEVDTRAAAASDDLADTVDYSAVAATALGVLTGDPVDLVETLADRVAWNVLADPRVHAVTVSVHKPEAPLGFPVDDVVVVIRRTQPDTTDHTATTGEHPATGGRDR